MDESNSKKYDILAVRCHHCWQANCLEFADETAKERSENVENMLNLAKKTNRNQRF